MAFSLVSCVGHEIAAKSALGVFRRQIVEELQLTMKNFCYLQTSGLYYKNMMIVVSTINFVLALTFAGVVNYNRK
jgi:hypothetical protein